MSDPELLAELRAVFVDELVDWLGTLEREVVVLRRPSSNEEQVRRSILEIRRAAHTLKGAARVVGHRDVEQLCHQLESQLPRDAEQADREASRAAAEQTLAALQGWMARHGPSVPEPSRTPAPAPDRAERPDTASQPGPPAEPGTVRVSAARVAEISRLSEELLVTAGRAQRLGTDLAEIEELLDELRNEVEGLRGRLPEQALTPARSAVERLASGLLHRRREAGDSLQEVCTRAAALTSETRSLRATRFDVLRPTLERAVLEAAHDLGKRARLELRGGEAELDRRIVDRLREPLVHLMRNAVDHGIEPPHERTAAGKPEEGRVVIAARGIGTSVTLTIEDDGRGIDTASLKRLGSARGVDASDPDALLDLLFEPGITTRRRATAVSGRGIGLDVVRQRVSELQGTIRLEGRPGEGARFTIAVPGDLSVARAIVVQVRDRPYAIVEAAVERGLRVEKGDRRLVEGRSYVLHEGRPLPLVEAARILGMAAGPEMEASEIRNAVVVGVSERRIALAVDEIGDIREVVIKPLGPRVRRVAFVTGATVLGDGTLACVLDPAALTRHGRAGARHAEAVARQEAHDVLVVDDSVTTRQLLVSILRAAGYRVETASDGEQAWRRLMKGAPPALVVSDIEMPNVDGFQLLSRIKSSPKLASLPVVLVTALSSEDDRRRALELGADGYVVKGRFDQAALLETIEELLP